MEMIAKIGEVEIYDATLFKLSVMDKTSGITIQIDVQAPGIAIYRLSKKDNGTTLVNHIATHFYAEPEIPEKSFDDFREELCQSGGGDKNGARRDFLAGDEGSTHRISRTGETLASCA